MVNEVQKEKAADALLSAVEKQIDLPAPRKKRFREVVLKELENFTGSTFGCDERNADRIIQVILEKARTEIALHPFRVVFSAQDEILVWDGIQWNVR